MKISRLLVLSALMLTGLGANAADVIERTEPTAADVAATPVAFEADHQYLLFNVGSSMFFSQGGAYGTKASVNPNQEEARRMYFTKYVKEGEEWDGKTYIFKIYSSIRSTNFSWHECFFDSESAMFVDRASQANFYWEVEDMGNNTYRLKAADANPAIQHAGLYVGYQEGIAQDDANLNDNYQNEFCWPISPKLDATVEGNSVDWQFFDASIFTAFEKSKELLSTIEKAEENGIDVAAAVAVYNDLNATVEQMEAAIKALSEAMNSGISKGTAENPTDATSLIVNPDFDNASSAGWLGSTPNMVGSGAHGPANVAEFYQGSNVDFYQELKGMPAGVYRLTMYGLYRSGNAGPAYTNYLNGENYRAKLYATSAGETLTTDIANPFEVQNTTSLAGATDWGVTAGESSESGFYIPNDPSCARVYFNQGWYLNTLFFTVGEDGVARIGLTEEGSNIGGDWLPFDEFRLTYFGNSEASFKKWVELSAPTFAETVACTASYLEAYNALVQSSLDAAVDKATAIEAVKAIKGSEALAALKKNINLWNDLKAKINEATQMIAKAEYADFAGDLGDYVTLDSEDILEEKALNNEELEAEIDNINKMMQQVQDDSKNAVKAGDDVTERYLVNSKFDNGSGWTVGKGSVTYRAGIAEAYGTDFDVYQDVKDPQVGVYKLELQGFFRMQRDDAAYTLWMNGEQKTDAGVYLGTVNSQNKTYLKCVYDEAISDEDKTAEGSPFTDGGFWQNVNYDNAWYANTMESATQAFAAGMYNNVAYGLVASKGETMRVGVSGNVTGANWICWDNFKLTFEGFENAEVIAPILEGAAANVDTSKPMGKDIFAAADKAKADAATALAGTDGKAMFDALVAIFDLNSKITASVNVFAELNTASEELATAIATQHLNTSADAEATALVEKIQNGIVNHDFEDADVPALKEQISFMITKLNTPDYAGASDDNAIDMTSLIRSANYDQDGVNSTTGWLGSAGNIGNDDTQKSALAYEFFNTTFNHYQDIVGLPNGTYEVQVSAFGRFGSIEADSIATATEPGKNESFLYASDIKGTNEGDTITTSVALKTLFAEGAATFDSDPGLEGAYVTVAEELGEDSTVIATTYSVLPNNMVTAGLFFEGGVDGIEHYINKLVVKVTGNRLRIGISKPTNSTNGWVIMDSWKLFYYGENSAKEMGGDAETDFVTVVDRTEASPVQQVELFTIDGRKAQGAQRGLYIQKTTLANGTVVVKKIRK